ncbi:globin family protein [Luteipulveratus halotolerans]|uniref:hypothetical protein n=1 Tax=Luteipulveratus halotolerans TaxID=1631356 RepID=UPI000680063D|nr:hypothetical protein [Luteipulveratus halotolerans]
MWIWLLAALVALIVTAVLIARLTSRPRPARHAARAKDRRAGLASGSVRPLYPDLPDTHQLTAAPVVADLGSDVPLYEWLRYSAGDNAWSEVVADFYTRTAADPDVADYFRDTDLEVLQRHFLAALMLVTKQGLTVGVVRKMQDRHGGVINSHGEPINDQTWDTVVGALVAVLQDRQVPARSIHDLAVTIEPLNAAIATGPAASS